MLQSLRAVAAVAVVALAASAGLATNRGVPAFNGDKFTADISVPSDVDSYVFRGGEGGLLTISAKQYKSALLPKVTLFDPSGNPVSLSAYTKGDGTKSVSVKKVPLDETGLWLVSVTGRSGGTTGAYTVAMTYKTPKTFKLKAAGIPANLESKFYMPADDGSLLTLSVKEKSTPPLAGVHLDDPEGVEVVVSPLTPIAKKGTTWSGKKIVVNEGLGDYALVLTGAVGGSTICDISFSVKLAKRTKLKVLLGPEPQVVDLLPTGGRDGTTVTITASNSSNPGLKVFFGDEEVAVQNTTANLANLDIEVDAPSNDDSDLGKLVPLYIQNTDGQGNSTNFQFHGTPGPSTVSPAFSPLAGGNTLTITGTGNSNRFVPGGEYEVSVGGQAANVLTVTSNVITCEAPNLGVPGDVEVIVTDPYGRDGPTILGLAYVAAPEVDDASPTSVSFEGGRTITVEGSGFHDGDRVFVDGEEVESVTVVNSTTLEFPMPAGPAGAFDLEVTDEFDQTDGAVAGLLHRRGPFTNITSTAIPATLPSQAFFAEKMAVGDIDGDDVPDIIATSRYDTDYGTFFIFRNDGSAVFAEETALRAPGVFTEPDDVGQAATLVLGDLDGNAGAEIVMSVRDPFVATDPFLYYAAGPKYVAYSVYEPTGDEDDLILDFPTYPSTRFLANDGAGNFSNGTGASMPVSASFPLFGVGERFQAVASALGDLDGDDVDDVVLVSRYLASATEDYQYYFPDLLFPGSGAYDVYVKFHGPVTYVPATRILLNDGSGVLTQSLSMPDVTYFDDELTAHEASGGDCVCLGDVDGDGSTDIVLALKYPTWYSNGPDPGYYVGATRVFLNSGDGTAFTAAESALPTPFGATLPGANSGEYWQADALALGDLDDDGDQDIIMGKNSIYYWYDVGNIMRLRPAIRIFRNDGDGAFTEETGDFLPSTTYAGHSENTILGVHSIQLGDLDGDGTLDILVTGHYSGQYDYNNSGYGPFGFIPAGDRPATRLLLNDGTGQFVDATLAWFPAADNGDYFQSDAMSLGDLDGDGDVDLVLGYQYYPYTALITEGVNSPIRVLTTE